MTDEDLCERLNAVFPNMTRSSDPVAYAACSVIIAAHRDGIDDGLQAANAARALEAAAFRMLACARAVLVDKPLSSPVEEEEEVARG